MIKIEKPTVVPASLTSDLVQQKREELIAAGKYIDVPKYSNYYKKPDVKDKLREIYQGKCVYCEQSVEAFSVEHFRPKSIYYWLTYSWDNLLYICSTCNIHKSNHFDIQGVSANFTAEDLAEIHQLHERYSEQEQPFMIHPEKEEVENALIFDKNGNLRSDDVRVQYVIDTCKLNRKSLQEKRMEIIQIFRNNLENEIALAEDKEAKKTTVRVILNMFQREMLNPESPFLAFRKQIWQNEIPNILKEILTNS